MVHYQVLWARYEGNVLKFSWYSQSTTYNYPSRSLTLAPGCRGGYTLSVTFVFKNRLDLPPLQSRPVPSTCQTVYTNEFWLLEIGHILGVSAANVAVFGPEMGRSCDELHNGSEFAVYTKRIYRMMANHGYSTLYCSTIDADGHVTTCSLSLVFTWFTTLCTVTTNQTCFNYSYLKAHSKDLSSQLSWWHRYLTHGC